MAKVKMKSEFFDFINFSSQSPKESRKFKKIINICNNLFYGDYYEKGGKLKTKEELDKRMKDSLIDSFVGFWGKQDKEYIENKINSAEIDYNYQILGKNSISEYLQNKKAEYIKGKIYCENYISNMFTQISSELKNNAKNIKKLLSSSDEMVAGKCKYCLESLGYSQEDVVNPGKMKEFMSRVKVYSEMEQNYSDNPKVNKDMKKLESVVKEYAKALDQYYKENKNLITDIDGKPYENVLDFNNAVWYRDTISKYTVGHYFDNQDYLFTPSNDVCACAVGGSKIRLGSNALDWVIIHEFIHIVVDSGFQKDNREKLPKEQAPYSNHLTKNQMFDEVITDYFTGLIWQDRKDKGIQAITSDDRFFSSYSSLFPIMNNFIKSSLRELKTSLISDNSSKRFSEMVGEERFGKIALLCNNAYTLLYNLDKKNVAAALEKMGMNNNAAIRQELLNIENELAENLKEGADQIFLNAFKQAMKEIMGENPLNNGEVRQQQTNQGLGM